MFVKQLDQFLGDRKVLKDFAAKHNLNVNRPGDVNRNVKKYFNKLNSNPNTMKLDPNWMPFYIRQADSDTGSFLVREYYRLERDQAGGHHYHHHHHQQAQRRKPNLSKAALYELTKLLVDNTPSIKQEILRTFRHFGGRDAEEEWTKFFNGEVDYLRIPEPKPFQQYYHGHLKWDTQTEMVDTDEALAAAIKAIAVSCDHLLNVVTI